MTSPNIPTHSAAPLKPFSLSITLPGLPKGPNQLLGAHWTIRSGHAKKWKRMVWAKCWHLRPPQPLERCEILFTRFSSAKSMDDDNLAGSFKSVRDGLKDAKIIKDDSPEFVVCRYAVGKAAPTFGRIEIEVNELTKTKE